MHSNLLIVGILAVGFTLASFLSYLMQRLKLPSILGYLLAGYLIGPYSPGFVANTDISEQLGEIGVILMLFGVGLHFKIEDLLCVKNIAIPGAIGQIVVSTIVAAFVVYAFGWSLVTGLIIGLAVSVASTVVLVRLLTDHNILNTQKGHIAVGWLVVEDIFTVVILLLLPTIAAFAGGTDLSLLTIASEVSFVLIKFVVLTLIMFTIGHKAIIYILTNVARLRSQELFTLTVLALVFLIAVGSTVIFGTSIALGAFIAGMVIGKTNVRHQAFANSLPLKDIFTVVFFLSIGMLFNPMAIWIDFSLFIGILAVILFVKPLAAYLITIFCGYPLTVALTVAIALAQIGEFSFILAEEAMNLKLIPENGFDLLVACALVSIAINPLLFQGIDYFENFLQKYLYRSSKTFSKLKEIEGVSKRVVVVGFGPVGREITEILRSLNIIPIIIENNIDTVSNMEEHNYIFFGDATEGNILKSAHIEKASHLIITIPDTEKTVTIIHAARHANPNIEIVARVQYIKEKPLLDELQVDYICTEEETLEAFSDLTYKLFT